jgi:predicted phage tail protein
MQRNIYLQGELGERFGRKFVVNTDDYAEIFKCINANRPDFLPYLRKCHEEDIGFILDTEEGEVEHEDLLVPVIKGDITLAIAPAGSKKGITKILAAIAIIAVIYFTGGFAGLGIGGAPVGMGTGLTAGGMTAVVPTTGYFVTAAGGLTLAGSMTVLFAANLALMGIQQIMAPDPAIDKNDGTTNYLFSGGASNAKEGDPIPLLYGELRVPGRPISIEVVQGSSTAQNIDNIYVDANGGVHGIDVNVADIA